MSISKAAAELQAVLAQVASGRATLLAAAVNFDEARTLVQQTTHGTSRPEPAQAIGAQSLAIEQLTHVIAQADAAREVLTAYLADISAGSTTTPATHRQPPPQRAAAQLPAPRDRIERLRGELPSPLVGKNTGRKTHGRWFVGDRPAQPIVSGDDDVADLAHGYLGKVGLRYPSIHAHVEVKLAALIRQRWEQTGQNINATVVINHEICWGERSCFAYLPRLLPPGCSVTVATPTTRHKFTGEPT